mgnify:CR=1 FL=1
MSKKTPIDKHKLVRELVSMQLQTVVPHRRLLHKDLRRLAKYIDSSINSDECCIWNGYVTNTKNSRGSYINFFFRNKKVALHRLLYENFKGPLGDDCYIKFTCEHDDNIGTCCNINHMIKYKYNTKHYDEEIEDVKEKNPKKKIDVDTLVDKITLTFD